MFGSYLDSNSLQVKGHTRYFYEARDLLGLDTLVKAADHYGLPVHEMLNIEFGHSPLPDDIRRRVVTEIEANH